MDSDKRDRRSSIIEEYELDEYDREEYERRRRARARRRYLERQRQIRMRRLMRLVSMAVILVLIIALAGRGMYKVLSKGGKRKPTEVTTEVKAEAKKEEIQAQKQPVMSAADIGKMSSNMSVMGWQQDKDGKWYRNADGTFYENGWKEIEGSKYYFDDNGYVKTGWMELDGKDYYFNEEGKYDSSKIRPMIALTYDDGPGQFTDELLDCLEENNARATFYMLGENVVQSPETVERMKKSGMELGNHTYNHEMLPSLDRDGIRKQLGKTNDALEDASGSPAASLRPPGGSFDETVQNLADMPIIKWSIDTKDWATRDADNTYQVVMDNAQDGSVVLMHDIHESSVKASLRMIPDLIEKGFKLVTVQELAEARGIDLKDGDVYYYFGEGNQQVE